MLPFFMNFISSLINLYTLTDNILYKHFILHLHKLHDKPVRYSTVFLKRILGYV